MVVFLGDVHNYSKIILYCDAIELSDCDLIQVGDFGVGVDGNDMNRLKELNDYLASKNIMLHVCRGNHDDPSFFDGSFRTMFSNIDLIPDYTIKNIDNKNILFIGGATSVDRKPNKNVTDIRNKIDGTWTGRTPGVDYWENEKIVFNEEFLRTAENIDIVVTHSAPSFVQPYIQSGAEKWFDSDPTLEEELNQERNLLSDVCFILRQKNNIQNWFYGHFHFSNLEYYENIRFQQLAIMEFYELR